MTPGRAGYNINDQYGTYFLTLTIVGWVDIFTRLACRKMLIESLKYCTSNKGLSVHAYVIMSNHMHLIVTAKENSAGLSNILRDFKRHTAHEIIKWILESNLESRREWLTTVFKKYGSSNNRNKEYQIWKQDNQPKQCIYPNFTNRKLNYIHNNPVKAGIVVKPEDYLYSSAMNYSGADNVVMEVDIIDFGVQEGLVPLL